MKFTSRLASSSLNFILLLEIHTYMYTHAKADLKRKTTQSSCRAPGWRYDRMMSFDVCSHDAVLHCSALQQCAGRLHSIDYRSTHSHRHRLCVTESQLLVTESLHMHCTCMHCSAVRTDCHMRHRSELRFRSQDHAHIDTCIMRICSRDWSQSVHHDTACACSE